jgi:hypothetical protein
MARHYFNTVENSVTGKPVNGATIEVLSAALAYVTIYSDDGTTTIDQSASPLTSDSTGFFEFWTNETDGTVRISYDGEVKRTISDVEFPDGAVSGDLTALEARMDAAELVTQDATVAAFKALSGTVGTFPYFNGTDTMGLAPVPVQGPLNDPQAGLVSGGIVVWETGLQFRISAATYYIGGVLYSSTEQTHTLDAADGSNPRIDVLYLDTAGDFGAVTGTAAASPTEPDVDPSTQLKRTFVLVGAAVSAPAGVSNENIYLENTEWTGTTSGAGWTLASATSPYAGTVNIVAAAVATNGYVSLDHGAAITITDADVLQLFIKPTVAFPTGRVIRAQWYNNGVALGIPLTIASGYWGFNASTLSFQLVAIPIPNFVLPGGTTGDQLRLTVMGGALSFQVDNIVLQTQGSGVPQTGGGGLTQAQADALYLQRGNNLSDVASAATSRTNLGLGTAAVLAETSTAEYRANTADRALSTDQVWAAADYVTLNDSGGNIAVDMSLGFNFAMTMDGDYTLSNPTNTKNGQTGAIVLTQDGTGTQTLAYGSNWKFAGGTDPTLSTAAGSVDVLFYQVISSTVIIGNLVKAIA